MLNVKCASCGASYKLSEDLYTRKAAGFGVVVTCRHCKAEIHVELPPPSDPETSSEPVTLRPTQSDDALPAPEVPAPAPDAAEAPALPRPARPAGPAIVSPAARGTPGAGLPGAPALGGRFAERQPAKKDPASGPFVALSPGLLGAAQPRGESPPAPAVSADLFHPDSEIPVDSSDFIREPARPERPKPPAARPKPPQPGARQKSPEPPPTRQKSPEPPPAKPKDPADDAPLALTQKKAPRPPQRSDDLTDDLLSADVGFDEASGGAPSADAPVPHIAAPDAALLVAPAPDAPKAPAPGATARAASKAEPAPAAKRKLSRAAIAGWLALALVGAATLALRGKSDAPAEQPAAEAAEPRAEEPATIEPPSAPAEPAAAPEDPEPKAPGGEPSKGGSERAPAASEETPRDEATPPRANRGAPAAVPEPAEVKAAAATAPTSAPSPAAPGAAVPAPAPEEKPSGPFNADAARSALAGAVAQASSCRKPGDPTGVAAVTITFSPSGRVTTATIGGPPFAGTPTGGCIAATLRRARVPAFEGDHVTVRKTVEIR